MTTLLPTCWLNAGHLLGGGTLCFQPDMAAARGWLGRWRGPMPDGGQVCPQARSGCWQKSVRRGCDSEDPISGRPSAGGGPLRFPRAVCRFPITATCFVEVSQGRGFQGGPGYHLVFVRIFRRSRTHRAHMYVSRGMGSHLVEAESLMTGCL